jgi:hypothetical protein
MTAATKEVLRLHTALAVREPADLTPETLDGLVDGLSRVYDELARFYFA